MGFLDRFKAPKTLDMKSICYDVETYCHSIMTQFEMRKNDEFFDQSYVLDQIDKIEKLAYRIDDYDDANDAN